MNININLKNKEKDYGKCIPYSTSIPCDVIDAWKKLASKNGFSNDKKFTRYIMEEILKSEGMLD